MEHQQDTIKGKWESSFATKHCLKFQVRFNWLHPKILSREARYNRRNIRSHWKLKDPNVTVLNPILIVMMVIL